MTTGSALYLILCIVTFAAVGIVLAYNTWQQSRMGGDFGTAPDKKTSPQATPAISTEAHA